MNLSSVIETSVLCDMALLLEKTPQVAIVQRMEYEFSMEITKHSKCKPNLFIVHAVEGLAMVFTHLRKYVCECNIIGLSDPRFHLKKEEKYKSVKEMAQDYYNRIKLIQPVGCLRLGGYSFGGQVALELAQLCKTDHRKVGLVILLDSVVPQTESDASISDDEASEISVQHQAISNMLSKNQELSQEYAATLQEEIIHNSKLLAAWNPFKYKKRVYLIKGMRSKSQDKYNYWRKHLKKMSVKYTAGDHYSILSEENAPSLGRTIDTIVRESCSVNSCTIR